MTDLPKHAPAESYWRFPSRSLTGGCLMLVGVGMLLYLWGRLNHPNVLEGPSLLWIPATAFFAVGLGWLFDGPPNQNTNPPAVAPAPQPAEHSLPGPTVVLGGNDLDRVRQLLEDSRFPFELITTDVQYNPDNNQLRRYALKATKPGYLADRRMATIVATKLQDAVPGDWDIEIQSELDKVTVTRKIPFPERIAPPLPEWIAEDTDEATRRYHEFKFCIGVNDLGERLEYSPKDFPHWLVIGRTGSGKSVFIRTIIEIFRAAGWPIFIGDGKTTDYESLNGTANIPMISADAPEHVRLLHAAAEEIDRRAEISRIRKATGHPEPFAFPPWLVLLDEFASMRRAIEARYQEEDKDGAFVDDFLTIVQKGREFRVHLMVASQDLYAKTIPGDALGNIQLVITLGAPSEMTLKKAFTKELEPKARRVGDTITAKGRGLVADPKEASVIEIQSYFGYTPGVDIDGPEAPADLRAPWRAFRARISDRIPRLYSRQWFAIRSRDDLKLPMRALNYLKMVNLDLEDGTPDPKMRCYDKQDDSYNGISHSANRSGALRELDRPHGPPTREDQDEDDDEEMEDEE